MDAVMSETKPPAGHGVIRREDICGDLELRCDVVIVGSGAGGATAAAELAEAGLEVIVLEEGGYYQTSDFSADVSSGVRRLYRDGGATMALGAPPVMYQEGRAVGGSTVINGGMAWRTPERVLDSWHRAHGVERIEMRDMEPYFERVEERLHVAYQDPDSVGRDNELLRRGAERKGWHVIPNLRNQVHCPGSNNCAFGCPTGAKQSALVTYVPRALHFGARIYAGVRVQRILRAGKRAIGAEGRVVGEFGGLGPRVKVHADLVILAAGATQTPALLGRSGFRAPSGQLGRNLSLHPNAKVMAVFDEEVRGWEGVHQAYQVREFDDEGLLFAAVNLPPGVVAMSAPLYGEALGELLDDYRRTVIAGVLVEDTSLGRVLTGPGGRPVVTYQLRDRDAAMLVRGIALVCDLLFEAGARRILTPFEGVDELRHPDDLVKLDPRRIPKRSMEVVTVHLMGTARMGGDRAAAVCDAYGRVYDADRLMICDASLFPSPIGVNPAETIHALATRNAHHAIDTWTR
jgi:choline dehydrogenase-like flavoprotein